MISINVMVHFPLVPVTLADLFAIRCRPFDCPVTNDFCHIRCRPFGCPATNDFLLSGVGPLVVLLQMTFSYQV